ncbi:MAG: hypothetical protein M1282_04810 [Chloroflexi bacterium]|nr:hypothetical protein [Chloroflexota bacterium]
MTDEEKKMYPSETLGLPPLKMVLVQAENDRQNEASQPILESPEAIEKRRKQKAIAKLIEHLNEKV